MQQKYTVSRTTLIDAMNDVCANCRRKKVTLNIITIHSHASIIRLILRPYANDHLSANDYLSSILMFINHDHLYSMH